MTEEARIRIVVDRDEATTEQQEVDRERDRIRSRDEQKEERKEADSKHSSFALTGGSTATAIAGGVAAAASVGAIVQKFGFVVADILRRIETNSALIDTFRDEIADNLETSSNFTNEAIAAALATFAATSEAISVVEAAALTGAAIGDLGIEGAADLGAAVFAIEQNKARTAGNFNKVRNKILLDNTRGAINALRESMGNASQGRGT